MSTWSNPRLRERIAAEAARRIHVGLQPDYPAAKREAARHLGMRFTHRTLPSNHEIDGEVARLRELFPDPQTPAATRRQARIEAVRLMRPVADLGPTLVGELASSGDRDWYRIVVRIVAAEPAAVLDRLRTCGLIDDVEVLHVPGDGPDSLLCRTAGTVPAHWQLLARGAAAVNDDGLTLDQLEALLGPESLEQELSGLDPTQDRFEMYRLYLQALEDVEQDPGEHPEGDALYHSLQVFDLAAAEAGYDEELLTAALLHDVGKATDPLDPAAGSLRMLDGLVTPRTAALIEMLPFATARRAGTLPQSLLRPLDHSEHRADVIQLAAWDAAGRKSGVATTSLEQALDYLRSLDSGQAW